MKNITVSIDDETYRRARIAAATRGTSVSALVRRFLSGLSPSVSDDQAWAELWESVDSWGVEVGERPTREGTYADRG